MELEAMAKAARAAFYGIAGEKAGGNVQSLIERLLVSSEIDWHDGGPDHWALFCLLSQMHDALEPAGQSDMAMRLEVRRKGRGRKPDFAAQYERRWLAIEAALRAYRISREPGWEQEAAYTKRAADEMEIGVAAIRKARNYPEYKMWIEAIERHKNS